MYVTRNLRLKDQAVDGNSPGFSGRFTAKAALTAIFGGPETRWLAETRISNMISGVITDFEDGNKDLDFKVTLNPLNIDSRYEDSITDSEAGTFSRPRQCLVRLRLVTLGRGWVNGVVIFSVPLLLLKVRNSNYASKWRCW